MARKFNLSLDDTAAAALDHLAASTETAVSHLVGDLLGLLDDAPSADPLHYVRQVLDETRAEWQRGVHDLREAGWSYPEIRAACHSLGGPEVLVILGWPSAGRMAAELADAATLAGTHRVHGVTDEAWSERVRQLAGSEALGRALLAVNREAWRGNRDFDAAVYSTGSERPHHPADE
jgi:hypothetical protein